MSYTLIVSGDKPGYTPNEDLNEEAQQRAQDAFRAKEMAEIKQGVSLLAETLKSTGHMLREVYLDGERLAV